MDTLPILIFNCFKSYLLYLAVWVISLVLLRLLLKPNGEVFRKALHTVAYTSSLYMMSVSDDWRVPALCCTIFAIVVYPLLVLGERWKGYGAFFTQRHTGEVKHSLLLLFLSHAILIALYWGLFDKPWIVYTSVLMWGTGDTAAALIGKKYGRHHTHIPLADRKKTWEGSFAMMATALLAGLCALRLTSPYPRSICLLLALAAAPVAAYTELITKNGDDTVTVAGAVSVLLLILSCFL
ncbi:MAG: phosphatidate cytidylyltransferase [Clostridia bacterium]|nr:phosphatidate cytidylyltransferase [Clostridia bacterium]